MADSENIVMSKDAHLYHNTGTYETPVWSEIKNIQGLSMPCEIGEADGTTRESDGYYTALRALKTVSLEFGMLHSTTADGDYETLRAAFIAETDLDVVCTDLPIATVGAKGFRATMGVFNFPLDQQLTEASQTAVVMKPTAAANPPEFWETVA